MLKPARDHACVDRKAPPYHLARPSIPRRMANPSTLPSHPPSRMVVLSTMFGTMSYGLRNECRVVEQDNQRKCSGNQGHNDPGEVTATPRSLWPSVKRIR
ncbi:Hypothetical predicted protein [Prunus dulcis]|uniref:Uncharacterized protein n=1 Tax=Prunus dulcis TaxID=3755 RepID=A0A5E4GFJ6_PRUDU|nr:Hypothetical predicted protein [Prunus dulcis]